MGRITPEFRLLSALRQSSFGKRSRVQGLKGMK